MGTEALAPRPSSALPGGLKAGSISPIEEDGIHTHEVSVMTATEAIMHLDKIV
jgi:hypothetical protein